MAPRLPKKPPRAAASTRRFAPGSEPVEIGASVGAAGPRGVGPTGPGLIPAPAAEAYPIVEIVPLEMAGWNPAAIWGSAPAGGSEMFRSWIVTDRSATPDARISYIGDVGSVEPPRPSAWPSSCRTVVSKSYWPAPIWLGSAPAYQFQPWSIVISPFGALKQPSTPSAALPQALVVPVSMTMLARVGSVTSVIVTLYGASRASQVLIASWIRASSSAVNRPLGSLM